MVLSGKCTTVQWSQINNKCSGCFGTHYINYLINMITKTYAINGVLERFIPARVGKGIVQLHFSGGSIDNKANRPAQLTTSNSAEQSIIENTPEFKRGIIKIIKTYGQAEVRDKQISVSATAIESVTNLQGARQYLMANGFELKDVATKADVLEAAKKLNITFPNWK